jgi:flagellar hook-associated protein 3 FlgL
MGRVTTSSQVARSLADITAAHERLARSQNELSSGKRIQRAEDDPFGTGRALFLRNQVGDLAQYQRNVDEAQGWLQANDIAMANITSLMQRARELTVQAANGSLDQTSLDGIAAEIAQIRDGVREQMNAKFAGRSVFSGTLTLSDPYPPGPPYTYAGNDDVIQRTIGDGQLIDLNIRGWEAFSVPATNAGGNVLTALATLETNLRAGNKSAVGTTDLIALDAHFDQLNDARAKVGARSNRLEAQTAQLQDMELNVKDILSKTENVDMAKAMVDFSMHQSVYESALRSAAKVLQPSLLDFLG